MYDPNGSFDPHNGNFDGPDGQQLLHDMKQSESRSTKPTGKWGGLSACFIIVGMIFCFIPGGGWLVGLLLFYAAWVLS